MSPDEAKTKADDLFDRLAALAPQVLEVVREARDFEHAVEAEAWSEGDIEGSSAEYYRSVSTVCKLPVRRSLRR